MSMQFIKSAIKRQNISEFEYARLDPDATQNFIMSISRLFDQVFETPNNDFENFTREEIDLAETDPAELLSRFFSAVDISAGTRYQKQFYKFAEVNITTIFKWYRKNNGSVNISPKQVEWFKRWFEKHGVGHEFLNELDPNYRRSIKPKFDKFFDIEKTQEGDAE